MGKIQVLSADLINHIAAGEVVERPASVVKELVENAMDAGATRIEIQVRDGGRTLRIADNGCGMDRDDLTVAFCNHATSKVRTLEDLFQIQTLGFRGEALASLAAIAKVTCISKPPEAETALKALVSPSGQVTLQETGSASGTIFEINDLFYNVPARLKFLKRPQTEISHIQEMTQALALSHPAVAMTLQVENASTMKTTGSGDLAKTMDEVFSLSDAETLLPVEMTDSSAGYRVWGQTSTPDVMRSSKKWVMTFVNGRVVRCPIFTKAIESAYQSLLTPGRFPITVLFLELPLDEVDVNVHPTKREVKYQQPNTMFSFVRRALESVLTTQARPVWQEPSIPVHHGGFSERPSGHRYQSVPPSGRPAGSIPSPSPRDALDLYRPMSPPTAATQRLSEDQRQSPSLFPDALPYQIIGQLAKTYILLESAEGLVIVDQHIAAERVLFEKFLEAAERQAPVSQVLLLPLTFPVSPVGADILNDNRPSFEALGFVYQLESDNVQFTQVPALYNEKVLRKSLEALLGQLEDTAEIKLSFDDVIATAACHAAIRAGDSLTVEQMRPIIVDWYACHRPWTCPHGRPVSHTLQHRDLMAFFDRPSLPSR